MPTIKLPHANSSSWDRACIVLQMVCISVNNVLNGNTSLTAHDAEGMAMKTKIVKYVPEKSFQRRNQETWKAYDAFNAARKGISLDDVLKNNVRIAKNLAIHIKTATLVFFSI
jgi:hypothetical protein